MDKKTNNYYDIPSYENQEFDTVFTNAEDILDHMMRGCEVEFLYNDEFYFIGYPEGKLMIFEGPGDPEPTVYEKRADALDHKFGDKTLVEILPHMKILFRAF